MMMVCVVWRGRRGRGRVGGAVLELRGRGHVALQGRAILRHVRVVAPEENSPVISVLLQNRLMSVGRLKFIPFAGVLKANSPYHTLLF